ncbi:MAG: flagellar basal body rod protein FlgB [Nitrospinae bacterium]|nr:flagellar basal body rod protein FlgB [Nitrospinota bacterium]
MDMMKIYGAEFTNLEKALKLQSGKHLVHASNIANVSTPKYQALEYSFEKNLKEVYSEKGDAGFLTKTNPNHLSPYSPPKIKKSNDPISRIDGNNVNIDKELTNVSKNNFDYNSTLAFLTSKYALLKYAMSSEG